MFKPLSVSFLTILVSVLKGSSYYRWPIQVPHANLHKSTQFMLNKRSLVTKLLSDS